MSADLPNLLKFVAEQQAAAIREEEREAEFLKNKPPPPEPKNRSSPSPMLHQSGAQLGTRSPYLSNLPTPQSVLPLGSGGDEALSWISPALSRRSGTRSDRPLPYAVGQRRSLRSAFGTL
jgi:hypothetical protein